MKLIAEYLEHALTFERLAEEAADDAALKEKLLKQAADYRLAEKRAIELGLPKPPSPS